MRMGDAIILIILLEIRFFSLDRPAQSNSHEKRSQNGEFGSLLSARFKSVSVSISNGRSSALDRSALRFLEMSPRPQNEHEDRSRSERH